MANIKAKWRHMKIEVANTKPLNQSRKQIELKHWASNKVNIKAKLKADRIKKMNIKNGEY